MNFLELFLCLKGNIISFTFICNFKFTFIYHVYKFRCDLGGGGGGNFKFIIIKLFNIFEYLIFFKLHWYPFEWLLMTYTIFGWHEIGKWLYKRCFHYFLVFIVFLFLFCILLGFHFFSWKGINPTAFKQIFLLWNIEIQFITYYITKQNYFLIVNTKSFIQNFFLIINTKIFIQNYFLIINTKFFIQNYFLIINTKFFMFSWFIQKFYIHFITFLILQTLVYNIFKI